MKELPGPHPRRLGLLGGTFDPFHHGHLAAATASIEALSLDRVVLVPTGQPWQKDSYSPSEDRVMMATLGASAHPQLSVSRIEVDRRGPTYTIDTLESFKGFFPRTDLYFIMGTDAARALGTWHRGGDLHALAQMVVVHRPPVRKEEVEAEPGWPRLHHVEIPGVDISSTDIRARVARDESIDELVPPGVARFIHDRGLFAPAREAQDA